MKPFEEGKILYFPMGRAAILKTESFLCAFLCQMPAFLLPELIKTLSSVRVDVVFNNLLGLRNISNVRVSWAARNVDWNTIKPINTRFNIIMLFLLIRLCPHSPVHLYLNIRMNTFHYRAGISCMPHDCNPFFIQVF